MMKKQTLSRRKPSLVPLLLLSTLLLSCVGTTSSSCPQLRIYTPEEQDQLYVAESQLSLDSPVKKALDDYGVLRNEVRACQTAY